MNDTSGLNGGVLTAALTYQRDHHVFSARYLAKNDPWKAVGLDDQLFEVDAMAGVGIFWTFISGNLMAGLGYRKHFQTVSEFYRTTLPAPITIHSYAFPVQAQVFIPITYAMPPHSFLGFGLSAYGTYTREGLDHGIVLTFTAGLIGNDETYPAPPR